MANLNRLGQYLIVGCALVVYAVEGRDSSYPCVGTSPCVKKFVTQTWPSDLDFFILNTTDEYFGTNCTQAQTCLNDFTGGGGVLSDITTAAVSFIYDVCSQENQQKFNATLKTCILSSGIRQKAESFHKNWLSERDAMLAVITNTNQVSKFCKTLTNYVDNIQETLKMGGCSNEDDLKWCMKIIRENIYEKYGAFCLCIGNCDCKNIKSISPVVRGNGTGAGYMMLVFGIFFLIGAILVKTRKRKE